MTDQIQPGPSRRPQQGPAAVEGPVDPVVDEMWHRLRVLEQEKRQWKKIGVTALVLLLLVVIGGGIVGVGTVSYFSLRTQRAEREARMEADRARMEAMRAEEALMRAEAREALRRQAEREKEAKNK
jgi:cell division protein FtsB